MFQLTFTLPKNPLRIDIVEEDAVEGPESIPSKPGTRSNTIQSTVKTPSAPSVLQNEYLCIQVSVTEGYTCAGLV